MNLGNNALLNTIASTFVAAALAFATDYAAQSGYGDISASVIVVGALVDVPFQLFLRSFGLKVASFFIFIALTSVLLNRVELLHTVQ